MRLRWSCRSAEINSYEGFYDVGVSGVEALPSSGPVWLWASKKLGVQVQIAIAFGHVLNDGQT
jgi:hypothetical protein